MMQEIGRNNELFDLLSDENSLLDAKVIGVALYESNNMVMADVKLISRSSSDFQELRLVFVDVIEFDFYYSSESIFYNVERVKFFSPDGENAYLSLDPYDEEEKVSPEDQDFILSQMVIGYATKKH